MRRALFLLLGAAIVACGFDGLATFSPESLPRDDASASGDSASDAGGDGPTLPGDDSGFTFDAAPAPVVPGFVPSTLLDPAAANLTGILAVNTSSLALDVGAGLSTVLPPGIRFTAVDVADGGVAVLSVGALDVDQAIAVSGSKPLVIVAAKAITINAVIDVSAAGGIPGPGGHGPGAGPGLGARGAAQGGGNDNSGGGGSGHGTTGASGGNTLSGVAGGAGGVAYTRALSGGSGGGRGDPLNCNNYGGAGGGALQIFSAVEILIGATGGVNAGGGGGTGGCSTNDGEISSSGGGGGSGGWILLEAPRITIGGTVAANGGGGGGGASGGAGNGVDGENGVLGARPADGGAAAAAGRQGGGGGSALAPPQKPAATTNCGAGGGAVGRIYLRTRGSTLSLDGGTMSPLGDHDGGL